MHCHNRVEIVLGKDKKICSMGFEMIASHSEEYMLLLFQEIL